MQCRPTPCVQRQISCVVSFVHHLAFTVYLLEIVLTEKYYFIQKCYLIRAMFFFI